MLHRSIEVGCLLNCAIDMAISLKDIDVDTLLVILDELEMTSPRIDRSISAQELATRLTQRNANLRNIPMEQVLTKVIQLMNEAHRQSLCQIPAENFYIATQIWEELSSDFDSVDDDSDIPGYRDGSRDRSISKDRSSKRSKSSSPGRNLRKISSKRRTSKFGKVIKPKDTALLQIRNEAQKHRSYHVNRLLEHTADINP